MIIAWWQISLDGNSTRAFLHSIVAIYTCVHHGFVLLLLLLFHLPKLRYCHVCFNTFQSFKMLFYESLKVVRGRWNAKRHPQPAILAKWHWEGWDSLRFRPAAHAESHCAHHICWTSWHAIFRVVAHWPSALGELSSLMLCSALSSQYKCKGLDWSYMQLPLHKTNL